MNRGPRYQMSALIKSRKVAFSLSYNELRKISLCQHTNVQILMKKNLFREASLFLNKWFSD
jgi:hypothetical protein